jgi:hypothetical protein
VENPGNSSIRVQLRPGTTTVGRGPVFGLTAKVISREQACFTLTDNRLVVTKV